MISKVRDRLYKELDRVFSNIVRKRDADEFGMILCPACKTARRSWAQMTCGHYRKRRFLLTRWKLTNAVAICMECNGHDVDLTVIIDQRFGEGTAQEMTALSHKDWHPSIHDLQRTLEKLTDNIL